MKRKHLICLLGAALLLAGCSAAASQTTEETEAVEKTAESLETAQEETKEESKEETEAAPAQEEEAENKYFTIDADRLLAISDAGSYTLTLNNKEGWQFIVEPDTDVTSWFTDAQGNPSFYGEQIASAQNDENGALIITIDASRITAFGHNGTDTIYVTPARGSVQLAGDNHGSYNPATLTAGTYILPEVTTEGELYADGSTMEYETSEVTVKLVLDDLDDASIDASQAEITLMPGDGYYVSHYTFNPGTLNSSFSEGKTTYTASNGDITVVNGGYELTEGGRGFGTLGGDGGGNYNLRIGISGMTYNGLPLADAIVTDHIYVGGRTFTIDGGSLIKDVEPAFTSDADTNRPILCDTTRDNLYINWPVNVDASNVALEDITLTLGSEYGETLVLTPGTDYTVESKADETTIQLDYTYWSFVPVYTTMNVDVDPAHLSYSTDMYDLSTIQYDYDIASVYAYNVMCGGQTGTQTWTIFGLDGLEDWTQVFETPTYTLSADVDGQTMYYTEQDGVAGLSDQEADALHFDASEDVRIDLIDNTVFYTRMFDQTEDKTVNGQSITFTKNYVACESLIKAPNTCTDVTVAPGYTLSDSWEEHSRWPWQTFINTGFEGGTA